jgi:DHA1 family multidrug resistance protein-like MFS transporter
MNAAFALLFALNIFMNFGNTGFDQAFNYYLMDQLGLTSSYNGIIKAAVGLISFASNMTLCLWIIRRTNVRRSITVLAAFCTVSAIGALVIPQIRIFIFCSVLVYAGYSVSLPLLQHMAAEQADPAQKNLVMGFYNATKSFGSIAGSLAAGFLYGLDVKLPFLAVAVTYGAAFLAAGAYLLKGKKCPKNERIGV